MRKGFVEFLHHLDPGHTIFDLIEFLLHSGGKAHLENVGKQLHQDGIHGFAQLGWEEFPPLLFYVAAVK